MNPSADFAQWKKDFASPVVKISAGGVETTFEARLERVTEPLEVGDGMVERDVFRLICTAEDAPKQSQTVKIGAILYTVIRRPELVQSGFAVAYLRKQ